MISPKSNPVQKGSNLRKIHSPEGNRSRRSWIKLAAFILFTLLVIFILSNLAVLGIAYWRIPGLTLYQSDNYRGLHLKANSDLDMPIGFFAPKYWHQSGARFH